MSHPVVPTSEQSALLAELPTDEPVVMVNLLRFKQPDGATHYARYAREVVPHLEAVGARALYAGSARAFVIGEGTRPWWDSILVVEYPTPGAFMSMVAGEGYAEVHVHREAALERAELIATGSWDLAV
ncbi:MAG TPA: DUF1330 domain-containing protein [Solirubrobacteraceae bacterium]